MSEHLLKYTLHLGDNSLILGHRNSEWTGHGPILEQDIALSNVALDLIGQARNFYQLAASLQGNNITEDDLAYLRGPSDFLNCLLVEQENGHWGTTILKLFFCSVYSCALYEKLASSNNEQLSAVAAKSLKEATYHKRWSSEWVIRLGQGTEESHSKMQQAIEQLWMYTAELYTPAEYEIDFIGDALGLKMQCEAVTNQILRQAGLSAPAGIEMKFGGKQGKHSQHLVNLLEEMQFLQRSFPGTQW